MKTISAKEKHDIRDLVTGLMQAFETIEFNLEEKNYEDALKMAGYGKEYSLRLEEAVDNIVNRLDPKE